MSLLFPPVTATAPRPRRVLIDVVSGTLQVVYVAVVIAGSVLTSLGRLLAIGLSRVSEARS